MDQPKVLTAIEGAIGIITLNDPATLNAAGVELMAELKPALRAFAKPDSGVRCVLITGAGRAFCSGVNLSSGDVGEMDAGEGLETVFNPLVSSLRDYPVPIVSAVNGPAAGVGVSLAVCADLIVAAESAYFLLAFRRIGLVPDGGATYLLSRHIGRARATEMALLGEKIPARTALEWGMINRCVPDDQLMSTAMGLANSVANGPMSLNLTRKLMWEGLDATWSEQLHAEKSAQTIAGFSDDCREGVKAFVEKRPAQFKGR